MPVQWACHPAGPSGGGGEQLPALRLERPPSARPEGQRIESVGGSFGRKTGARFCRTSVSDNCEKDATIAARKICSRSTRAYFSIFCLGMKHARQIS